MLGGEGVVPQVEPGRLAASLLIDDRQSHVSQIKDEKRLITQYHFLQRWMFTKKTSNSGFYSDYNYISGVAPSKLRASRKSLKT
jgi:hypothetical protein